MTDTEPIQADLGSDQRMLRVGIVGCGGISPAHAKSYLGTGRVEIVGAADLIPERAHALADRFPIRHTYDSLAELLTAQHPDLVSVATPPGTHADLVRQVLAAGCDVLVEKPPCRSLAELDAMLQAEGESRGTVYAVFQHRHGSGAIRAKSTQLGRPLLAVCETLWFRPDSYFDLEWRGSWEGEGGGPTLGHGIHQIDLMVHLMGPWDSITATAHRAARSVDFEDVSVASTVFANGAIGAVINSLVSPHEISRVRVDSTSGTLEVNHLYGYRDADWTFHPAPGAATSKMLGANPGERTSTGELAAASRIDSGADGVDAWERSAGTDIPSNHPAQINVLVDDLLAGRQHETTLASARMTMELITGLYASALLGRTVQRTELVPGHRFYDDLSGGLGADMISRAMSTPGDPGRT